MPPLGGCGGCPERRIRREMRYCPRSTQEPCRSMSHLPPSDASRGASPTPTPKLATRALRLYRWILDLIVTALVFIMVLTLLGALAGLILDFSSAAGAFGAVVGNHKLAHGLVYATDRELVIDVLSVFVLIELFRTFTDYLEFHRVRLRVLAEVGIAFTCGRCLSVYMTIPSTGSSSSRSRPCWRCWSPPGLPPFGFHRQANRANSGFGRGQPSGAIRREVILELRSAAWIN